MKTTVFMVQHKSSKRWLPKTADVGSQDASGWVSDLWDARQYKSEESARAAIFAASATPYGQLPYPNQKLSEGAYYEAARRRIVLLKATRQAYMGLCEVVKVDVNFTLTSMPSRSAPFGQVGGRVLEA